ncbi:hypothetical protein [Pseudomonas nitroreducens]|uniref:Uncharacterized protein n=1 Tax=Pseudomonas nitroreducens TaxID=46680 RepID=A0A6G6IVG9_PSENT|nr:hypothetical protein [Pseudomonas nitroreducens]QIE86957.1 hypothetical protein G5B91_12045 [Pseudomonas nitroreducens]
MSWYASSWQHMLAVRTEAVAAGKDAADTAKAIDDSYPYSERSGWAYKAWLDARRSFFRQHNLPMRRAKKPEPDLLKEGDGQT